MPVQPLTLPRPPEDPPALTRRTAISFVTTDTEALARWLCARGYSPISPKPNEAARLTRRAAIVILYASGSVVIQGKDAPATIAHLAALAQALAPAEQPSAQLDLFDCLAVQP